jgi:hypothetical protein
MLPCSSSNRSVLRHRLAAIRPSAFVLRQPPVHRGLPRRSRFEPERSAHTLCGNLAELDQPVGLQGEGAVIHARHALAERRLQVGRPTMLSEEIGERLVGQFLEILRAVLGAGRGRAKLHHRTERACRAWRPTSSGVGPIYRREVCAISPRTNWSCSSQHSSFINRSRKRGGRTDPGVFTDRFSRGCADRNGSASVDHQRGA